MSGDADVVSEGLTPRRRAVLPSPTLPLVYLSGAHLALATALAVLAVRPDLPGPFVYHPQALALVHLVTLGWLSGSILGALYVVAPLALGVPLRASTLDAWSCLSFWVGTSAVASGFWIGRFDLIAAAACFVLVPFAVVGTRLVRGLSTARLPFGVSLHVVLAFLNVLIAAVLGLALAASRHGGGVPGSPMSLAAAHAHLAMLGWVSMMILGVAHRLIPMVVPAAMPSGPGIAVSAVLLEGGTVGLTIALATERHALAWALIVVAAFVSFFVRIARVMRQPRLRPADLPRPDWSTWQTLTALACLFVAMALGVRIAAGGAAPSTVWVYGTVGVLGFAAQMVAGIAGRLVPMQAWYRALERQDGVLPTRSVHRLIAPRLAGAVLVLWLVGLPLLTIGLAGQRAVPIVLGALALLGATGCNAVHGAVIVRRAQQGG